MMISKRHSRPVSRGWTSFLSCLLRGRTRRAEIKRERAIAALSEMLEQRTLLAGQPVLVDADAGDNSIAVGVTQADPSILEIYVDGNLVGQHDISQVSTLTINGLDGDDTLNVDFNNGNPIPDGGLQFDGGLHGANGDNVVLVGNNVNTVAHTMTGPNDGLVDVDGQRLIYNGIEPIFDRITAVDRSFTFTRPVTDGVFRQSPTTFGVTQIASSQSEAIDFSAPTGTLTVNLAHGDNVFSIESSGTLLSTPSGQIDVPALRLNSGAGNDTISVRAFATRGPWTIDAGNGQDTLVTTTDGPQSTRVTVNGALVDYDNGTSRFSVLDSAFENLNVSGGQAGDVFNVIPRANTPIHISGGAPTVAPGDLLEYVGDGTNTLTNPATGSGFITQLGLPDLTYDGIESVDTLSLAPPWQPQGAGPAQNGQIESVVPNNQVSGAIHTVIAHPTNPDIVFIGGTNGGIWRTVNATALNPNWEPLIDDATSLSIGAMEFDPTDLSYQTIWAGRGRVSSYGRVGGARSGLLVSRDGGSTWTEVDGGGTLNGLNISGLAARGDNIVVSVNTSDAFSPATTGIFRSTDGGVTFTQVSVGDGSTTGLPSGVSYDLASDPANQDILYTSTVFSDVFGTGQNGIYKSVDFGASWTKVSNAAMDTLITTTPLSSNLEISVGANDAVYVAIIDTGALAGLFRSPDGGQTWTQMDTPSTNENGVDVGLNPRGSKGPTTGTPEEIAGGQGFIHFSILADPNDPNIVYVGGDRQPHANEGTGPQAWPNSIGANNFSGRLFRGDASQAAGSQFVHLTHSSTAGPAGGGTASNSSPHADSREMVFDANGNIVEVDDGGVFRRTSPRDNTGDWFALAGDLQVAEYHDVAYDTITNTLIAGSQDNGTQYQITPNDPTWSLLSGGDGGDVAVDDVTLAAQDQSIRYSSFQNLGALVRRTFDAGNNLISTVPAGLAVATGAPLAPQFVTPLVLNEVDPTRVVIGGGNSVYESFDQADTLTEVGVGIPTNFFFGIPLTYGGFLAGVPNPDVIYTGSGSEVFVRTVANGPFNATAFPGGSLRDIELNPDDWRMAFAADSTSVYMTSNSGGAWTNVTGNLPALGGSGFHTLKYIDTGANDVIIVGTDRGVFGASELDFTNWYPVGAGLPNAPIWDSDYDAQDDVLVLGTMGRGAWTLFNASEAVQPLPTDPIINGDSDDNIFIVRRAAINPALTEVEVDGVVVDTYISSVLQTITINGLAGNDRLIVEFENSNPIPVGGIAWSGGTNGAAGDDLVLQGGSATSVGHTFVNQTSGTVDVDGRVVTYFGLEPVFDNLDVVDRSFTFNDSANTVTLADNGIVGDGINRISSIASSETVDFLAPTGSLTVNGAGGNDIINVVDLDPGSGAFTSTVWGIQPSTGNIVRVNPITGAISGSFAAPDALVPGGAIAGLSLAEGGTTLLYQNGDNVPADLYRLDPTTGAVLSVETMAGGPARGGLSYDTATNSIFAVDGADGIDRQDGFGGPVAKHIDTLSPDFSGALGGDDHGRQFASLDGQIHEFSAAAANSSLGSFTGPVTDPSGLAFDGGSLFLSDLGGSLFTLDPDTGAVQGVATVAGGNLTGLAARQVFVPASFDIFLNGDDGNDTFDVDFAGSNLLDFGDLTVDGGIGNDSLALLNGSATTVNHRLTNADGGRINIDGGTINYDNLEARLRPASQTVAAVHDFFAAANRGFTFLTATTGSLAVPVGVNFNQIDSANSATIAFPGPSADLQIDMAPGGNNQFTVGNVSYGSGSGTATLNGADFNDTFLFQNTNREFDWAINGGAGTDTFTFDDGAGGGDTFTADATSITVTSIGAASNSMTITDTGIEAVNLNGSLQADIFDITPRANTVFSIDGSDPILFPGDLLIFRGAGLNTLTNPATRSGFVEAIGFPNLDYADIEEVQITDTTPGTVTGLIWEDLNGDGIQDPGEPGMFGATARLINAGTDGAIGGGDDSLAAVLATGVDGVVNFTNVAPGHYFLQYGTPAGFTLTLQDAGTDDTLDSDADPATAQTGVFSLFPSTSEDTFDAGMTGAPPAFGFGVGIGGSDATFADEIRDLAVDVSGNIYVVGAFSGLVDFDPGPGTVEETSVGAQDGFVAQFTSAGALVWLRTVNGTVGSASVNEIELAGDGTLYLAGEFQGTVDILGDQLSSIANSQDIFVAKIGLDGSPVWTGQMGAMSDDRTGGLAVDSANNVLVGGTGFGLFDVDPDPDPAETFTLPGGVTGQAFVAKLDANRGLLWAAATAGTGAAEGHAVTVDSSDNVIVHGSVDADSGLSVDFDPGAANADVMQADNDDPFVWKLDANGLFRWVQVFETADDGGNPIQEPGDIVTDLNDNIYVAYNHPLGTDVDPGPGTQPEGGSNNAALVKLDDAGNFIWGGQIAGTGIDAARGLTATVSGDLYVAGRSDGGLVDFDISAGTSTTNLGFNPAGWVVRYDSDGNLVLADVTPVGDADPIGGITHDPAGNIYTGGRFTGTIDADPTGGVFNLTSAGVANGYFTRLADRDPVVDATAADETIILRRNQADTSFIEIEINGTIVATFLYPTVNTLGINGLEGTDTLIVDYVNGDPVPVGGLTWDGGTSAGDNDTLVLDNGSATVVDHTFANASDGTVLIDTAMIDYFNLEPIVDNIVAVDRIFTFVNASTQGLLEQSIADPARNILSSDVSETVDFPSPSGSLTINLGGGGDNAFDVDSLAAGYSAATTTFVGNTATDLVTLTDATDVTQWLFDGRGGADELRVRALRPDDLDVRLTGTEVGVFSPQGDLLTAVQVQAETTTGNNFPNVVATPGLDTVEGVSVSPDGAYVYATSTSPRKALLVFNRDAVTGELTLLQTLQDVATVAGQQLAMATQVDGLADPRYTTVSPDGSHVYVSNGFSSVLSVFAVDAVTGMLTSVEVLRDGVNGIDGLRGAGRMSMSADGRNLYVTGNGANSLVVFARDAATGQLTLVETFEDVNSTALAGAIPIDGLRSPGQATVSPDGMSVFVASETDQALLHFDRNPATGQLTFREAFQDAGVAVPDEIPGATKLDGLEGSSLVTVSPDSRNVYLGALNDSTLLVFRRDAATGNLGLLQTIQDEDEANLVSGALLVPGLSNLADIAVRPDGRYLFTGGTDNEVVTFLRDPGAGTLIFGALGAQNFNGEDGTTRLNDLAVSPDGVSLYAASLFDQAITSFRTIGASYNLAVDHTSVENILVDTVGGSDTFTVVPDANTEFHISADAPAASPGDTLRYRGQGTNTLTDPPTRAGTVSGAGVLDVNYIDVEDVLLPAGTLIGRKWHDRDFGADRDATEPFLNGWTIELLDGGGSVIDTAVTADIDLNGDGTIDPRLERGVYVFSQLAAGNYSVREVNQVGWTPTFPAGGQHDVTVVQDAVLGGLDFGNTLSARLAGRKYHDRNVDARRQSNEEFLNNFVIQLLDENRNVLATQLTHDIDFDNSGTIDPETETGWFVFPDLLPGFFTVREVLQPGSGWFQSAPIVTKEYGLDVLGGDDIGTLNFGNFRHVEVVGQKFEDIDGDGQRGAGESLLNGWTIELVDAQGNVVATDVTKDVDLDNSGGIDPATEVGVYRFLDVAPGDYTVREVLQPGWRATSPPNGAHVVFIPSQVDGESPLKLDFGNTRPPVISGRKFHDRDADGTRDTGEEYLNGWTIELLNGSGNVIATSVTTDMDLDGNGTIDPDTERGWYEFAGLDPSTYNVREIQRPSWTLSVPAGGSHVVTVNSGEVSTTNDFGNYQDGTVRGRKFHDLNGDGDRDANEPYLNGWTIELLNGGQVVATSVTTDIDIDQNGQIDPETERGWYSLTGDPGLHTVRETIQTGWAASSPVGGQTPVTLRSAETVDDTDFGNFRPVTIQGRKFLDRNLDGVHDAGTEEGLNNWTIQLRDLSNNLILSATTGHLDLNNDNQMDPLTESGWFVLNNVPPGTYRLNEIQQSGWVQTAPVGGTHLVTVVSGQGVAPLLFGNYQLGTIQARKFHDIDGDGQRSAGEAYLNGWTIELFNSQGALAGTAVTADIDFDNSGTIDPETESGWVQFTGLTPDNYTVREVLQTGWGQSVPASGFFTEPAGNLVTPQTLLFGNHVPVELHGRKFHDRNADGVRDAGEEYLNGWTIEVVDGAGNVVGTAVTMDADLDQSGAIDPETESGWYWISDVVPGDYTLREVGQAGWTQSAPGTGSYTLTGLLSGDLVTGLDFGNYVPVELHGRKFHDRNGNGVRESGEEYLNGWTIELVDDQGSVVATAVTMNADLDQSGAIDPETETGWYWITGVVPGDYTLREVQQTGWGQSAPAGGVYTLSDLSSGTVVNGLDFGNHVPAELHGRKFHDRNGDGVRDAGEEWLNGWTIELVDGTGAVVGTAVTMDADLDQSGTIEPETETGWYWIMGVAPGRYTVREVVQTGWAQSTPDHVVIVNSEEVVSGLDFGNYVPIELHGRKFHDRNADGVRDAGEEWLNDWTVELVDDQGNVVDTVVTMDADLDQSGTIDPETESGWYWITDVAPGDYTVREVQQAGWVQSAPAGGIFMLTGLVSGDVVTGLDFGNYVPAEIHGRKFHDRNADGDRDDGEEYLNGWTVELVDDQGNVVDTVVTMDADIDQSGTIDPETESGWYWLQNVVPGTYTVREVARAGWMQSVPAIGSYSLDVDSQDTVSGVDFGNYTVGHITGRKFHDLNANGTVDAGEGYLNGWTIELRDDQGGLIATTVTGDVDLNNDGTIDPALETGWYQFRDLTPGDYQVHEVLQTTWLQSAPAGGFHAIALQSTVTATVDFGNYQLTSIEGRKFHDRNADGVRDANDEYLNGWTIQLLDQLGVVIDESVTGDSDGDGVPDAAAPVGLYRFDGLTPGDYGVREVQQAGWFQTAPAAIPANVQTVSGGTTPVVDFGNYQQGSIHVRKFHDSNANGQRDGNEVWLNGWTFELVDEDTGNVVATAVSMDVDLDQSGTINPDTERGWVWFNDVDPDDYIVREVVADGWFVSAPAEGEVTVTLSSGQTANLNPFGNYVPVEIHGRKFNDENGNGVRDAGEAWLNGWTFELVDSQGAVVDTVVTADMDLDQNGNIDPETESGLYWILNVRPGDYTLREVPRAGWVQSTPNGPHDLTGLQSQEVYTDIDFGNFVAIEIHGRKYHDVNANGTRDPGEVWLNGWTIELRDDQGAVVKTAVTMDMDLNQDGTIDPETERGLYWLLDVAPGDYSVHETPRAGWAQSDPAGGGGHVLPGLESQDRIFGQDFGNYVPVEIHGRKFHDVNANGVRDAGEDYLNGWTVELLDGQGLVVATVVTDDMDLDQNGTIDPDTERGLYWFLNVVPGDDYAVREVARAGWRQSIPGAGGLHSLPGVESQDRFFGQDFGNYRPVQIGGRKFHDLNANGVRDGGEPYLNGWTIVITSTDGSFSDSLVTGDLDLDQNGTIDPDTERGWYRFVGLDPNDYEIREIQQSGWVAGVTASGTPGEWQITVDSGAIENNRDFGNFQLASLTGRKYHDRNADGQRNDQSEEYLNGFLFELLDEQGNVVDTSLSTNLDLNQDGTIDPETETGIYRFVDVVPGNYQVREAPSPVWQISTPPGGVVNMTLASAASVSGIDFGNYQPASIHGRKFHDRNGNTIRDTGEEYLNGITIQLHDESGNLVTSTTTMDMDLNGDGTIDPETERGLYWLSNLIPGSYRVSEVVPAGWQSSLPGTDPLALRAFELDGQLGLHFTGNFFLDWGGEGERWIRGANREWYYILPNGELYEWDGASGRNGVPLNGTLVETFSAEYHANPRLLSDARNPFAVVRSAETLEGVDFGNFQPVAIHGRKWNDLDGDGVRDAGEDYLNGWTIELKSATGETLDTVVTMDMDLDNDGAIDPETERGWYWFNNLRPGTYLVDEVIPDGWEQTSPGYGPQALEVFELERQLGLKQTPNLFEDYAGLGEKWLLGSGGRWHYITPDGTLYEWDRMSNRDNINGTVVAQLDPFYHRNIERLADPVDPRVTLQSGQVISDQNFGNRATDQMFEQLGDLLF